MTDAALDAISQLPILEELDDEPTVEELGKAIDALTTGKAPGEGGIPPEVIKAGKEALIEDLHELLCLCWREGSVPSDMRGAKIVTLYKNKGDRSECNSYRGISLLSIVGKVFARVILARLQVLAAQVYPESQCGFRAGRSTIDMIFSVRQLQEKCQEQNKPLFLAFLDLTKAFDLVSRSGLFQLLKKIGCPQSFTPSSSRSTLTCRALCASMAQHPTHFLSTVESSRAACSPQPSSGSSSRCYSPMLSKTTRTGSTYTHVPMVNSTTWPGSEPKPRSGTLPSGRSSSLTMLPWQRTRKKHSRG